MRKIARIRNLAIAAATIFFAVLLIMEVSYGLLLIILALGIYLIAMGGRFLAFYFTMAKNMVDGMKIFYLGIIILDLGIFVAAGYGGSERLIMMYLMGYRGIVGVIALLRFREARKNDAPWKRHLLNAAVNIGVVAAGILFGKQPNIVVYVYCASLFYSAAERIISTLKKTAIVYVPT